MVLRIVWNKEYILQVSGTTIYIVTVTTIANTSSTTTTSTTASSFTTTIFLAIELY